MNTTTIELTKLESIGNKLKRILAIFVGIILLILVVGMLSDSKGDAIQEGLLTILMLVIVSGILIYYGFMRSKIHKKCYLKIYNDMIEARWPIINEDMTNYRRGRETTFLYNMLLKPEYEEIKLKAEEIDEFVIIKYS